MVDVLTDLHKLDGSMNAKEISYSELSIKNDYYNSVLKKHDLTQAEFDSSLVWYSQNPKKFDKIYDNVIENLTNLESEINKYKYHPIDSTELAYSKLSLWNKQTKYTLTKDSARTHLDFEIPGENFMLGDVYVLKFIQRIGREDSCTEPFIRFQINYANGKIYRITKPASHDGVTRRYTFRLPAIQPSKIKSISGQLLGSKAYKGKLNATIDSITLTQVYKPAAQDSLLKVLQKTDPKHYPTYIQPTDSTEIKTLHRNIRLLILKK